MSTQNQSLLGRLFSFIWGFIVGLYKTIVILGFVISLVLLWAAFRGNKPVQVEDNIALVVAPTGQLVDQVDRDAGEQFFENLLDEAPAQTSVREITEAFTRAATDERIPFAVLKMDEMWGAGQAQLAEITAAVKVFQASGKKVVAYGPWFDQSSYYAAAAADEVVVDPLGGVAIEGFSYYGNFFKDGLDKLGVVINVFRVGEYKSAVEPFTRNDMSPESKEANQEWLGDLWREYNVAVASGRKLKDNAADEYVRGMADGLEKNQGDSAAYAKLAGLVTHVETLSDFRARMGEKVGMDDNHGSFRQIHFRNYLSALDSQIAKAEAPAPQGHIALVVVQGELADGDSDQGVAGGDTISELLDEARRDEGVDAVLLRVDSPGGSVWASEQIRRAVQNLQKAGKPVVASFGNVAASGGYWVSMDADRIFAHANTITGSIGIFGMIPTLDQSFAKLGIHTDGVGTTSLAGALRLDRPISPEMGRVIQSQINKGYRDFIEGVSAARELPVEKVDSLARGRVWSGEDAKALGLVDELGGLDQAAAAAAELAKLETWEITEYQPDRGWTGRFLSRFSGQAWLPAWAQSLSAESQLAQWLRVFNDPRGMYAYCFCTPSLSRSR